MTSPQAAVAAAETPNHRERRLRRRCAAMVLGLAATTAVLGFWVQSVHQAPPGSESAVVQSLGWRGALPARGSGRDRASAPVAATPAATPAATAQVTAAPAAATQPARLEAPANEPPPKIQEYQVQPGDTASGIAERFGLGYETVLWANNLSETSLLQIGATLRIPAHDGLLYTVEAGDNLWDLAQYYGVDLDQIVIANPDVEPGALQLEQLLLIPGARPGGSPGAAVQGSAAAETATTPSAARGFSRWPLEGPITSPYGYRIHPVYGGRAFHEGMDIGAPTGATIRAVAAGRVTLSGWYGGWGLSVKVEHGGGIATRYSHASVLLVKLGEWVEAGQPVAQVGSTGISTGPHLDFGVYLHDHSQDPADWLP